MKLLSSFHSEKNSLVLARIWPNSMKTNLTSLKEQESPRSSFRSNYSLIPWKIKENTHFLGKTKHINKIVHIFSEI